MQFVQLKNKKVYHTWVGRYYQYHIYIQELIVMKVFHFHINDNGKTIYSSIDHKIYFSEFEETIKYIEKWVNKNLTDKKNIYSE